MTVLALLLLAGLVFVIAAAGPILGRPRLARLALAAPVIAMAMVAQGLWADAPRAPDGPYGKVWATITSVAFDMEAIGQVRIGGDSQADDLVVSPTLGEDANRIGRGRLPPGILVMTRDGKGLAFTLGPQTGPGDRAVVQIEADRKTSYLGAEPLEGKASFCVLACDGDKPVAAKLANGQVFDTADTPLMLEPGAPPRSQAVYFTPIDSAKLMAGPTKGRKGVYHLAKGEKIKLTVFEAIPSTPPRGEDKGQAGHLAPRRGFDLQFDGRRLTVGLRTPETTELAYDAQQRPAIALSSGAASDRSEGVGEDVAVFELLGHPFDSDLSAIRLDAPQTSAGQVVLRMADGVQQPLEPGQSLGGSRQVQLQLRILDLDSGVGKYAALFAGLALALSLCATFRLRLQEPMAALLFGALDLTLALRLLIAVEGSFVDSGTKAQGAVAASLIAIPFGAYAVLTAHPRAIEYRLGAAFLAAMTLAAVALARLTSGASLDMVVIALAGLALGAACMAWRWPAKLMAGLDRWSLAGWTKIDRPMEAFMRSMGLDWGGWATWAVGGALFILGLRFALGLGGLRESISKDGIRFGLSLVFVPLTLAVSAPLIARAAAGWSSRGEARTAALALWTVLLFGVMLPSHIVKDNGFAVFALPVTVAALAAVAGGAGGGRPLMVLTLALLATAPLVVGGVLYLAGRSWWLVIVGALLWLALIWGTWWSRPSMAWLAPIAGTAALLLTINGLAETGDVSATQQRTLTQAQQATTNSVRFYSVLSPARLAAFGTRTADAMQDTNNHMRDYGRLLAGRGYFNLPAPTVLKPYHLTDNLSAVHLISPYGRLGAAAFLLISGGMAALACAQALARNRSSDWMGALAALTLCLISAYMILANLLAILFTGRNVYLLAAASGGDLLEGLTLFALVAAALGSAASAPKAAGQ